MAVPKRKTSKMRKRIRRSHDALKVPQLANCENCYELKTPHIVCPHCGFYKGEKIVSRKEKS